MLYKKLYAISLAIYAFLTSRTIGGEYFVSNNSGNGYICNGTDRCDIYCNEIDIVNGYQFSCGNASECYLHCDEKKCAEQATILATNSNNLYVDIGINGQECLTDTNIYTPNNGNAYFTTTAKKGFRSMNVHSGTNTQSIIIDSSSGQRDKDDCKEMNVYASTADYLKITIGDGQEFETSTIECPVNSAYNGPDIAPCIIDGTNAVMADLNIVAPDGVPFGVYVTGSTATNVQVTCNNTDYKNGADGGISTYPFDITSDCWWTRDPTNDPTLDPTNIPTSNPTKHPTNNPILSTTTFNSTDDLTNTTISTGTTSSTTSNNPSVFSTTGSSTANSTVSPSNPMKSTAMHTITPSYTTSTSIPNVPPTTSLSSTNPNTSIQTTIASNTPTKAPKYWICDEHCKSTAIHINASYWFSDTVRYDLQNIECFLYKIFVNYLFWVKFDVCDIAIVGIYGGAKYNDETFCQFKPCLFDSSTTQNRRLSENNDGNSTMTITGINNTYAVINELSLDAMETEFENDFLENFGVILDVTILIEAIELDKEDENEVNASNDTFWDSLSKLNILWYIVMVLVLLLCCIGCVSVWYIRRSHQISQKLSSKLEQAIEKKMNGSKHVTVQSTSNATKNTTVDTHRGLSVNRDQLEMVTHNKLYSDGKQRKYKHQSKSNAMKNTTVNIHKTLSMNRDQLEMVTHNKLYSDGKKRKYKHESKSTHDFDDEPSPTLSSNDPHSTHHIDVEQQINDANNYNNLGFVSWEQQQQSQEMMEWQRQQRQMHNNNNNNNNNNYGNHNAYNNALSMYNQKVIKSMNYEHGPRQSMAIDSILPNTVYNLTNQYNNNNNNNNNNKSVVVVTVEDDNSTSTSTSTSSDDEDDSSHEDETETEDDTDNANDSSNDTM